MGNIFGADTGVLRATGNRIIEDADQFIKNSDMVYNTIDDLMTKGYISDTGMEIAKGIKDKQVILKSIATTINRYGEYLNNTSTKVDNTEGDISSETRRELN
jgi:hypothetical protein